MNVFVLRKGISPKWTVVALKLYLEVVMKNKSKGRFSQWEDIGSSSFPFVKISGPRLVYIWTHGQW